ncbi:hypothetical protein [Aliikangiella sp. G2MR2-5]|uniref:hypothetical protein n=1 Tax=Aliikangiella sp. G2MR2-5 TaxID=2788943 RepID=UPI0018AA1487|nr:hypothetical protein [Aliikangiella sp. G2MR2-5]
MNKTLISFTGILLSLTAVFAVPAQAGSSSTTDTTFTTTTIGGIDGCPEGFYPIPSGLACAAENLTIEPTAEAPPGEDCPPGFERVPGVRFCVATNLQIQIPDNMMLLEGVIGGDCPPGFSRPVGSTICVADNLVLDTIEREVKLVKFEPGCPEGFHQPVGVRFCVPENFLATQLPLPNASDCPPGFYRPPGVRFCVASTVVEGGNELINPLAVPEGECPKGWYKGVNGFCMPENKTTACHDECGNLDPSLTKVENILKSRESRTCASDEYQLWWDMPVFDKSGKIVGFVNTQSCAAKTVTYMPNGVN